MVYIPEIVPGLAGNVETRRGGIAGDETASYSSPDQGRHFRGCGLGAAEESRRNPAGYRQ